MLSGLRHFFQEENHRHPIDYLADVNSGVSAVALFPQLFALLGGQSPTGLSPLTFILIAMNSIVWLLYGIHRKTPPLIISSTLNAFASVSILALIYVRI